MIISTSDTEVTLTLKLSAEEFAKLQSLARYGLEHIADPLLAQLARDINNVH